MFYDLQPLTKRNEYKRLLALVGSFSRMFSENESPYLVYRAHENFFCRYFEAENLARYDCSADAKIGKIGVGLKTWVGNDDQKVAEFGKLRPSYEGLSGYDLIKLISVYRNERIRVTKKLFGLDKMVYHVVKRIPGAMQIYECPFDPISIDDIKIIENKGNENNTYFSDGKHEYHFNVAKNTLYMVFSDMELLDEFPVEIEKDPYNRLVSFLVEGDRDDIDSAKRVSNWNVEVEYGASKGKREQLCLPLYSIKNGEKYIPQKSGLNQWNAGGRRRDQNEIYIPYQMVDRKRNLSFFPPRDQSFVLHLPDGTTISAKVCQEADKKDPKIGKAIMSNPNKVLGKWLLRDVFEVNEGTVLTYDMLERFGVDSVVFTKNKDGDYSVDFSNIGTYEEFYPVEADN